MLNFLEFLFVLVLEGLFSGLSGSSSDSRENKKITYGFNEMGEYVPKSIGDDKIEYGFNALGKYSPKSIGGKRITYGFNAKGEYVPKSFE